MSKGTKYKCKSCGVSVELFVTPTTSPTHKCTKRANRVHELEIQNENRNSKR